MPVSSNFVPNLSNNGSSGANCFTGLPTNTPLYMAAEKPLHLTYLLDFRTEQCQLFLKHKCNRHRPYTCFYWHFANQRRRRPLKLVVSGNFNYHADIYCATYDEATGLCPTGDTCPFLHRTSGDTERRYHLRYYKTEYCVHETDTRGFCVKNGVHCAFAHGTLDLREPVMSTDEIILDEFIQRTLSKHVLQNCLLLQQQQQTQSSAPGSTNQIKAITTLTSVSDSNSKNIRNHFNSKSSSTDFLASVLLNSTPDGNDLTNKTQKANFQAAIITASSTKDTSTIENSKSNSGLLLAKCAPNDTSSQLLSVSFSNNSFALASSQPSYACSSTAQSKDDPIVVMRNANKSTVFPNLNNLNNVLLSCNGLNPNKTKDDETQKLFNNENKMPKLETSVLSGNVTVKGCVSQTLPNINGNSTSNFCNLPTTHVKPFVDYSFTDGINNNNNNKNAHNKNIVNNNLCNNINNDNFFLEDKPLNAIMALDGNFPMKCLTESLDLSALVQNCSRLLMAQNLSNNSANACVKDNLNITTNNNTTEIVNDNKCLSGALETKGPLINGISKNFTIVENGQLPFTSTMLKRFDGHSTLPENMKNNQLSNNPSLLQQPQFSHQKYLQNLKRRLQILLLKNTTAMFNTHSTSVNACVNFITGNSVANDNATNENISQNPQIRKRMNDAKKLTQLKLANLYPTLLLEKDRSLQCEDYIWADGLYVLVHYKTEVCTKPPRLCRQGYACPAYHNDKDRRRSPALYKYRSTPCPIVKHGDEWSDPHTCENEDECSYCHTRTEQQFHPEIFKTTKCNDMIQTGYCPRGPFCAFAHYEQELSTERRYLNQLMSLNGSVVPAPLYNINNTNNLENETNNNNMSSNDFYKRPVGSFYNFGEENFFINNDHNIKSDSDHSKLLVSMQEASLNETINQWLQTNAQYNASLLQNRNNTYNNNPNPKQSNAVNMNILQQNDFSSNSYQNGYIAPIGSKNPTSSFKANDNIVSAQTSNAPSFNTNMINLENNANNPYYSQMSQQVASNPDLKLVNGKPNNSVTVNDDQNANCNDRYFYSPEISTFLSLFPSESENYGIKNGALGAGNTLAFNPEFLINNTNSLEDCFTDEHHTKYEANVNLPAKSIMNNDEFFSKTIGGAIKLNPWSSQTNVKAPLENRAIVPTNMPILSMDINNASLFSNNNATYSTGFFNNNVTTTTSLNDNKLCENQSKNSMITDKKDVINRFMCENLNNSTLSPTQQADILKIRMEEIKAVLQQMEVALNTVQSTNVANSTAITTLSSNVQNF